MALSCSLQPLEAAKFENLKSALCLRSAHRNAALHGTKAARSDRPANICEKSALLASLEQRAAGDKH